MSNFYFHSSSQKKRAVFYLKFKKIQSKCTYSYSKIELTSFFSFVHLVHGIIYTKDIKLENIPVLLSHFTANCFMHISHISNSFMCWELPLAYKTLTDLAVRNSILNLKPVMNVLCYPGTSSSFIILN